MRVADRRTGRTLRLALIAVVVVIAVGAVAAVAQPGGLGSFSAHTPPTKTVDNGVTHNVAVFERKRTADDALPAAAIQALDAANTTGANADLSRRAIVSGDETLYLVPADDKVCASLVAADGTAWSTCNYAAAVADGTDGPGFSVQGTTVTLVGIVPDQVSKVSVTFGDGAEKALETDNNAYIARLDVSRDITSVVYTTNDGRRTFPLAVPDLAAITRRERAAAATR